MTIQKEFTNLELYNMASFLLEQFNESLTLPIKANFYLQKNINAIVSVAREVEKMRFDILDKYGTKNEETNTYEFSDDNAEKANVEISELLNLTQDVTIYPMSLEDFGNVEFTTEQVSAIMFMLTEEE